MNLFHLSSIVILSFAESLVFAQASRPHSMELVIGCWASVQEGLPKSMSAQEALKFKEDTLKKQQPVWGANPFESSAELPESVDWRTLLNAAGLADVADEDIKLEAEELQSKIDAYVPKSRFTWCSALLSCLWPMRS